MATETLHAIDRATIAAAKLDAMLSAITGERAQGFRNLDDDLQDNYLWACADLAHELQRAVKEIH
jgi:hypothetical protein